MDLTFTIGKKRLVIPFFELTDQGFREMWSDDDKIILLLEAVAGLERFEVQICSLQFDSVNKILNGVLFVKDVSDPARQTKNVVKKLREGLRRKTGQDLLRFYNENKFQLILAGFSFSSNLYAINLADGKLTFRFDLSVPDKMAESSQICV